MSAHDDAAVTVLGAIQKAVAERSAFEAIVTAVAGGMITVQRLGAVTPEGPFGSLTHFPPALDDVVLCVPFGGGALIYDVVQRGGALTGKLPIANISPSGGSDGQYLMRLAGALAFGSFQNLHVRIANRGSSSGNVTGTSYGAMASLQTTITLETGIVFDVFALGNINAQAPASETITMAVSLDGTVDAAHEAVTATTSSVGLGFGGIAAITGDGTSKTFAAANKVSGGTGVLREGILLVVAIARN